MPYYTAGDYYGRAAGDYYRGDFLGIGKALGKIGRGLLGGVGGLLTAGPVGAIAGAIGGLRSSSSPSSTALVPYTGAALPSIIPTVPLQQRGLVNIGGSGAQTGLLNVQGGGFGRRRRRMNPMNVHALRRASRRIDGFVKTARRALKHTPFTISRKGSRGGSPGVITRAEAARALRK